MVEEFLRALTNHGKFNLHVNVTYGSNSHHIAEAVFKAIALTLGSAVKVIDPKGEIPSTKGQL